MKYGSGQMKHCGGKGPSPETTAPRHLIPKQAKAMDPSRGPAPNSGQTRTAPGGRGKGSTKE